MGSYFTGSSPPPRRIIHKESHHQHSETHALNYIALIVLSIISVVILVIVFLLLLILCREKEKGNGCKSIGSSFRMRSYDRSKQVSNRSSDVKVNGIGHSSGRKRGHVFTYKELEIATDGFSEKNVIGNGGNGVAYKGVLSEGTVAAIKLLNVEGKQGERKFRMEVDLLTRLHSHYLVDLLGYCADQHHRFLVFEYMPNGCLQQHLHPTISQVDKPFRLLDWRNRLRIALDCARALEFLHEHLVPSLIHRDFKCSNILLDHSFGAKVSGFGMAKTCSTGYIAPEYESTGKLTTKSDVYSYGVVLLELLTGRVPVDTSRPRGEHVLVSWALPRLTNREKVVEMVDPALQGQYSKKELIQVAAIAAVCIQSEADYRPLITDVVQSLIPLVKSKSTTLSDTPAKFKDDQVSIMMP